MRSLFTFLLLLAAATETLAGFRFGRKTPARVLQASRKQHAHGSTYRAFGKDNAATCTSGATINVKAPQRNIFQGLTDIEFANVTSFLHQQKSLNLTSAANATSWDNTILNLDLLQPNKSDALRFLDSGAAAPPRYAQATLQFGATTKPYIREYMVGPLPVTKGKTTVAPLDYIYNKGQGVQRVYNADPVAQQEFGLQVGASIQNVTKKLLNGTATGADTDNLLIGGNDPLIHDGGRIYQWNQFYTLQTNVFFDETILPTGLEFQTDITGRDPSKWKVTGWYYNGQFWKTTSEFIKAAMSPSFKNMGAPEDGPFAWTDPEGTPFPHDDLYPPVMVAPQGPRYAVDAQEKYVEWMGFSFYLGFTRDTGMQLHDIRYNGTRIIYELGLQEALAHYAAIDPLQASTAYLDSYYGFGSTTWELVSGFDCPAHATYLNTSFFTAETTHTHPNSICLFELDAGYPISRHLTATYVTAQKNVNLIVRSVATVGNYDYMFEYAFNLDGSIHVTVRASGYIQGAYYAQNQDYGFHINDVLSGDMHDHVINYKLDLDVQGTANSVMSTSVVPAVVTYPWSKKPISTMRLQRTPLTTETALDFPAGGTTSYTVYNAAVKNKYGENPGFSIGPATGTPVSLTIQNSTALPPSSIGWSSNHLYALQRHDTEPRSAYPYNNLDPANPPIDFTKFLNGESLKQEDVVLYFNLGMHHVPQTQDLGMTVFTTAVSGVVISPVNYFEDGNPARRSRQSVRIDMVNGSVASVEDYSPPVPACVAGEGGQEAWKSYTGEVVVQKFPFEPDAAMVANPGGT